MKELKIRLAERIRIYQDSAGCNATYIDLKHFAEDLLEILDELDIDNIGFKKEEQK